MSSIMDKPVHNTERVSELTKLSGSTADKEQERRHQQGKRLLRHGRPNSFLRPEDTLLAR